MLDFCANKNRKVEMKRLLLMTGMLALLAGCATYHDNEPAYAGGVGSDSDVIRGVSPGNDRVNTGTETARGVADLGAASLGDQLQREPVDPRDQWVVPSGSGSYPGPYYRRY
jgi:hypothetical protein